MLIDALRRNPCAGVLAALTRIYHTAAFDVIAPLLSGMGIFGRRWRRGRCYFFVFFSYLCEARHIMREPWQSV